MKAAPSFQFLRRASGLLLAAAFFGLVFLFSPFRERFEFDLDEGVEVMKGFLLARGYPMYTQIWSEQPPLFTYLLAVAFRLFGFEVDVGRILVLLFSALLLAASFYFLYLAWGYWHALVGALLIILLPYYVTLSVSVMIGLPAVALAVVSLAALGLWHRRRWRAWLVLSAAVLALSVLIKIITAFLAPLFIIGLLCAEIFQSAQPAGWRSRFAGRSWFTPALLWGLVFVSVAGLLGLLMVGPANLSQLLDTHLLAEQIGGASYPGAQSIYWHLRESWAVLLLALLGVLFTIWKKNWLSLYLVAWAITALLLLSFHEPVWYHHQLLVTVPAALLAGIASGEGVRLLAGLLRQNRHFTPRSLVSILALVGLVLVMVDRYPKIAPELSHPAYFLPGLDRAPWPEQMFLVKMANHAPETRWVVTNLPMYAFRVGLPVPPPLAVMSEKRIVTGELTEAQIIAIVQQVRPEQVLLGRREFPELEAVLKQDYRLLYSRGKRQLYLRKDIRQ